MGFFLSMRGVQIHTFPAPACSDLHQDSRADGLLTGFLTVYTLFSVPSLFTGQFSSQWETKTSPPIKPPLNSPNPILSPAVNANPAVLKSAEQMLQRTPRRFKVLFAICFHLLSDGFF